MHFIQTGPGSWFNLPKKGGVAYAAQESWVQNETIKVLYSPCFQSSTIWILTLLKNNILFGAPYDEARYTKGDEMLHTPISIR